MGTGMLWILHAINLILNYYTCFQWRPAYHQVTGDSSITINKCKECILLSQFGVKKVYFYFQINSELQYRYMPSNVYFLR